MLQCVAVSGSVFTSEALCSIHRAGSGSCSVLQYVAVSCRVLQYLALCCSVPQCIQCVAVCCSVLQCVAVYYSQDLQCSRFADLAQAH